VHAEKTAQLLGLTQRHATILLAVRQLLSLTDMRINMRRFWNAVLLGAVLLTPIAITPSTLQADDRDDRRVRKYRDNEHNDEHQWDRREDRAYRIWVRENHRKYNSFDRLRDDDRQNYWRWRHEHSDSVLRINIR
jgi:hypothetical protein